MKEKVIIQTTGKSVIRLVFYALAIFSLLLMFIVATAVMGDPFWAFIGMEYGYYGFLTGAFIFAIIGLFLEGRPLTLTVTNVRIMVTSFTNRKKAQIPVNGITAIGCGLFKRISASTSGGSIVVFSVNEKEKVFKALTGIIFEYRTEYETPADVQFEDDLPTL